MTSDEKRVQVAEKEAAVDAIEAGEKTQAEVARQFGVSRQAVSSWVKKRARGHVLGPRGRPVMLPLTAPEKDGLREIVRSRPPSKAGIRVKTDEWTIDAVRTLLHRERGRWYTESFVRPLMVEWGLLEDAPTRPATSTAKETRRGCDDERPAAPRRMSRNELSYYEEQVRQTQAMMKDKGVVLDEDVAPGHGIRSGKHAKGSIQKKRKKKRKKKRR